MERRDSYRQNEEDEDRGKVERERPKYRARIEITRGKMGKEVVGYALGKRDKKLER